MSNSDAPAVPPQADVLDDRKATILRAIVEHYVERAQPVGSQAIAAGTPLRVSPATVRNDMNVLEREGYIVQPHTSAGRVPTDKGYRFYVDHFPGSGGLPAGQRREVADFFTAIPRMLDDLLHDTSHLLARITAHAAVVVGPQPDVARVRSVTLVELQPGVLLVIAVMANGAIERHTFTFGDPAADEHGAVAYTDADLQEAGVRLSAHCAARTLAECGAPELGGQPSVQEQLMASAYAALVEHATQPGAEPVFVGGASRVAAESSAYSTGDVAEQLLEMLEQHAVVTALMRELLGPGVVVRIGSENDRAELRESSLVLAPYLIEGEPAGTIGILGPTRMDYAQARAAVATVSQLLGRSLSS